MVSDPLGAFFESGGRGGSMARGVGEVWEGAQRRLSPLGPVGLVDLLGPLLGNENGGERWFFAGVGEVWEGAQRRLSPLGPGGARYGPSVPVRKRTLHRRAPRWESRFTASGR